MDPQFLEDLPYQEVLLWQADPKFLVDLLYLGDHLNLVDLLFLAAPVFQVDHQRPVDQRYLKKTKKIVKDTPDSIPYNHRLGSNHS